MSAAYQQPPARHPRPVKRFPRNPLNDQEKLGLILQQIHPLLMKAANKITKPHYIDPEDLVQEAYLKILKNKNVYDSNKGASPITWLLHIAINQFQSTATTEFRKKRVPQGINISKSFMDIDDLEDVEKFKVSDNPFAPYENKIEYDMRYNEIIDRTEARLPSFAKEVFHALIEPPQQLIDAIKQNIEEKEEEKRQGKAVKVPFHFVLTSHQLAKHFDVPRHKIAQAKDTINNAILKAFQD
ncbi:MAG: sigma factor [Candidatus Thorarchaeota archaeon]|nr:hypothetical protein [Thermoplasmatales archaeon]